MFVTVFFGFAHTISLFKISNKLQFQSGSLTFFLQLVTEYEAEKLMPNPKTAATDSHW